MYQIEFKTEDESKLIKVYRTIHELSQKELADRYNISRTAIANFENHSNKMMTENSYKHIRNLLSDILDTYNLSDK